jgi:hypothetical protein
MMVPQGCPRPKRLVVANPRPQPGALEPDGRRQGRGWRCDVWQPVLMSPSRRWCNGDGVTAQARLQTGLFHGPHWPEDAECVRRVLTSAPSRR